MSVYYNSSSKKFYPIPESLYYVLSDDMFFSGWGRCEGKINVCVVPCDSYKRALTVSKYIKSRSEQKRVRIVCHKPRNRKNVVYSLLLNWLKKGGGLDYEKKNCIR